MANLPHDLILQILPLLPIDSVLRFRSVSKSWRRLIETPYFSRIHHLKQQELNQTKSVTPRIIFLKDYKLYVVNLTDTTFKYKQITNVPSKNLNIMEIQSCNGVLCLHFRYRKVVIWNPLSDKYQELLSPVPHPRSQFGFGFGYDRVSYDYKLVALQVLDDIKDDIVPSAMIYSVKSDRWKCIDGFNYMLQNRDDGVFLGDSVHWLTAENKCIVAFNLTTDQFHEIPLPSFFLPGLLTDIRCMNIGVFSGCLTLTCSDFNWGESLYMMKVYGNKDSWVTLRLFDSSVHTSNLKPIAYMENGKLPILEGLSNLFLYQAKNKSVEKFENVGETHFYEATLGFYGGMVDE